MAACRRPPLCLLADRAWFPVAWPARTVSPSPPGVPHAFAFCVTRPLYRELLPFHSWIRLVTSNGKAGGGVRIARQAPSRTAVPVLAKAATTSRSTQTRRRGAASTTTTPGHGLRFRCVAGVCAPSRCHPLASAPLADQYWVRGTPSRPEHWTTGTEEVILQHSCRMFTSTECEFI